MDRDASFVAAKSAAAALPASPLREAAAALLERYEEPRKRPLPELPDAGELEWVTLTLKRRATAALN